MEFFNIFIINLYRRDKNSYRRNARILMNVWRNFEFFQKICFYWHSCFVKKGLPVWYCSRLFVTPVFIGEKKWFGNCHLSRDVWNFSTAQKIKVKNRCFRLWCVVGAFIWLRYHNGNLKKDGQTFHFALSVYFRWLCRTFAQSQVISVPCQGI